jgi:hypothetical protein
MVRVVVAWIIARVVELATWQVAVVVLLQVATTIGKS